MRSTTLLRRNLAYYWRTNAAVVFGVAAAVAVLAGALVVGESVRASLRELFLQRLGSTDQVVVSTGGFFREQLAAETEAGAAGAETGLGAVCPVVAIEGAATHESSGRRASRVQVYGVDERFWQFHGRGEEAGKTTPRGDEALLSAALAQELQAGAGEALLLRVEKPSDIPVESLHGRKEDVGRTLRLAVRDSLAPEALGEFSLRPQQAEVRAVFVPLRLLQKSLGQEGKVNTLLVSAREGARGADSAARAEALRRALREKFAVEDLGVKLRALEERRAVSVESESGLVGDALAESAT